MGIKFTQKESFKILETILEIEQKLKLFLIYTLMRKEEIYSSRKIFKKGKSQINEIPDAWLGKLRKMVNSIKWKYIIETDDELKSILDDLKIDFIKFLQGVDLVLEFRNDLAHPSFTTWKQISKKKEKTEVELWFEDWKGKVYKIKEPQDLEAISNLILTVWKRILISKDEDKIKEVFEKHY